MQECIRTSQSACQASVSGRSSTPKLWWGLYPPAFAQTRSKPVCCRASTSNASSSTSVATRQTYVTKEARKALFSTGVEQVAEVQAQVKGKIPDWLKGSAIINGGGDYRGMKHMFDGYAMVSKLRIEGGKVYGTQRYIDTKAHSHFASTGKMRWREFATPIPASNPVEQLMGVVDNVSALALKQDAFTDNASVNIVPLADGSVLALSEGRLSQYRVDPRTLGTLSQATFSDDVPGDLNTAHPKVLPDGRLINFTRSLPFGGFHVYVQDPRTLARKQLAFIPDRYPTAPSWVHDMALSARHLIICETPLNFNMPALMLGNDTEYVFMDWQPQDGSRVHVIALDGSGVQTFDAPTFFTFHYSNAFEDEATGELHVDMAMYDDATVVNDLALPPLMTYPGRNISNSYMRRLTIPLRSPGARLAAPRPLMKDEAAHGNFAEFPAFNPAYKGKRYRYCWALAAVRPTNMGNALGKFDLEAGTSKVWHEEGAVPGEPIFVASPTATSEDDGVLLAAVMSAQGASFMLVLDAKSMTELARAELPYAIPYRFHGAFIPA